MNNHLGYEAYESSKEEDPRNGVKSKKVKSNYGELNLAVSQDRNSSFEPKLVPKRKKINEIEGIYELKDLFQMLLIKCYQ